MTNHYVGPVILASDIEAKKRQRVIKIELAKVYKDIDLYTHKHVDSRADMDARPANAVSSDSSESIDGAVLARYISFRDAQLRELLQSAMGGEEVTEATSDITLDDSAVVEYHLLVASDFNDAMLRPMAEYMHRFLVFGSLYDWYSQFGMAGQAEYYGRQAAALEDKIKSAHKGKSIVKRPLQPFGPANKM